MKFKFDTATEGEVEAGGLVVALVAIYGERILEAPYVLGRPASLAETLMDHASPETLAAIITDGPAADGYPTEPNAAEAFGEPAPNTMSIGSDVMAVLTGPTRDSAGIPWDERIHSSTKGINKDGTWSRRRNTPDATFDSVMAELKGKAAAPASTGTAVPPAPTPTAASEVPPPATSEVPPPPPPPAGDAAPIGFAQLMVKITKAQSAGSITREKVLEFLGGLGLTAMPELAKASPDTLAAMNAMVDDHVGG